MVTSINNGLLGLEAQRGQPFVLDASDSYDPSASLREGPLSYQWTCNDLSSNYQDYMTGIATSWADYVLRVSTVTPPSKVCSFWDYANPPKTMIYTESSSLTVDTVLAYSLTMSDTNGRSSISTIFIRVVNRVLSSISFKSTPVYRINTDRPFHLAAKQDINYNTSGLRWIYASTGKDPIFLTPFTGTWLLTVAENSMSPGASYTFSLTYTDNALKTTAVVSINTNTPPSDGLLYLDKLEGAALVTIFNGQMLGWIDDDLPLQFSFSVSSTSQSFVSDYLMTGPQSSPVFATFFSKGTNVIYGYCYDSLGARSGVERSINITDMIDIVKISDSSQLIPYEINELNAILSLQMSGAVALQTNNTFTSYQPVYDIKNRLLTIVNQAVLTANNIYEEGNEKSAVYIYYASIMALETITRQPTTLEISETALNILDSIPINSLAADQTLFFQNSNITATSPQTILSTKDFVSISKSISKIIVYITDLPYSSTLIALLSKMIIRVNQVLSLNLQLTEQERTIDLDRFKVKTAKDLLSNLQNTIISLDDGVSVRIPSLTGSQPVQIFVTNIKNNPFSDDTITLDNFIQIDLFDAETDNEIKVKGLEEPFLITFNVSRDSISTLRERVSTQRGSNVNIWPECSYWENTTWSSDGCSLYNMGDIYSYFEFGTNIPSSFKLVCACNHLTQFSVSFRASTQLQLPSFIIREDDDTSFSLRYWESSLVIYLMLTGLAAYLIGLSFAYYWDNFNPGLSIPSVETEKAFRYSDPKKVEAVLGQLEKEFIRQLQDNNKSKKSNPNVYISKILSTGLVSKLMQQNEKTPKGNFDVYHTSDQVHPVEKLLFDENEFETYKDEEDYTSNKYGYRDENMIMRIKKYLKKGIDDPRYNPTVASDPDIRGTNQLSRKDLETTVAQLKLHMNHLETNTQASTPVDQFLSRYDDSLKLSPNLIRRLRLDEKELKKGDLKALGYNAQEFAAIRCDKNDVVVPDTTLLTGGKYCKS